MSLWDKFSITWSAIVGQVFLLMTDNLRPLSAIGEKCRVLEAFNSALEPLAGPRVGGKHKADVIAPRTTTTLSSNIHLSSILFLSSLPFFHSQLSLYSYTILTSTTTTLPTIIIIITDAILVPHINYYIRNKHLFH